MALTFGSSPNSYVEIPTSLGALRGGALTNVISALMNKATEGHLAPAIRWDTPTATYEPKEAPPSPDTKSALILDPQPPELYEIGVCGL